MNEDRRTSTGAARVTQARAAGPDHQVVSVEGAAHAYRRRPCGGCPWVTENDGEFPAEAFVHSARTSYDLSQHVFACHEMGAARPVACAGFLLRGAEHNLSVRLRAMHGELDLDQVHDDGRPLHASYRDMAVANGVCPDDPALTGSR